MSISNTAPSRAHPGAARAQCPSKNPRLNDLKTAVADSLNQLDPGWHVLVDPRISSSTDVVAADYMVMHAQAGVALIDLTRVRTDNLRERLQKLMRDTGFSAQYPGTLPIVHLVVHTADTWLGDELEAAFADAGSLTVANPQWVRAFRHLLVSTEGEGDIRLSSSPSSAAAAAPSGPEREWEALRSREDKLRYVLLKRDVAGRAQTASISGEQARATEDQEWRAGDQPEQPFKWGPATEATALDKGRSAFDMQLVRSLVAAVVRSPRVCASILLLTILSGGTSWFIFSSGTKEVTTAGRTEVSGTYTLAPVASGAPAPDTAPAVSLAEAPDRPDDLGAQPLMAETTDPDSGAPLVVSSQVKPVDAQRSTAVVEPRVNAREAPRRSAVSVRRAGEQGRHSLIFEWPREVDVTVQVANGNAKIEFRPVAQIDLQQLSRAASGLNPRVSRGNGNIIVALKLPPRSRLTAHHRGNRVVVDIASKTGLAR